MKVLLLHNRYQLSGGEDAVYEREHGLLLQYGHQVMEYTRDNREIANYGSISKATLAVRTTWAWDSHREIAKLLAEVKPDVAHFHNTLPLISPAAYYACKAANVPVVQTLHNYRLLCPAANFVRDHAPCEDCLDDGLIRSIRHGCYKQSRFATTTIVGMLLLHRSLRTYIHQIDKYVTPSEFAKSKFVEAGFPSERMIVKSNFVDRDPGIGSNSGGYALFVGRLSQEKGLITLLEAWKRNKDLPLHIVGEGEIRQQLQTTAASFGLSKVQFFGKLEQEKVYEQMKGATVLVFPSEAYETFGMAIVEAYACGLPVVASRLGAMFEIVHDGRTGLHFWPGDADDLAAKVEWACLHPAEMREMGRNARKEYEERYTASRNYEMLLDIYKQAIQRKQRLAATNAECFSHVTS